MMVERFDSYELVLEDLGVSPGHRRNLENMVLEEDLEKSTFEEKLKQYIQEQGLEILGSNVKILAEELWAYREEQSQTI